MQKLLPTFNRETAFTFVSLVIASYVWITTEKLILGIAVGIAMHAIQVAAYEILAARFSWRHLEIANTFRAHVLPRIQHLLSKTQRA